MKINSGLYPSANPSAVQTDTKSYALNVQYNEDGNTLIPENGFYLHKPYSDYGTCIGTIPIPTGVVLFFVNITSVNPKVPQGDYIIYHNEEDIDGNTKAKDIIYFAPRSLTTILNFDINRPISGAYSYNKNKHLIITFTEGNTSSANETRLMNLNTFAKDYNIKNTSTSKDYEFYSLGLNDIFIKRLNLIPDVKYPTLIVNSVDGGGLLAGAYQFAIAYKLKTGDYTDYSLLSPSYFAAPKYNENVKAGNLTSRKFKIDITNIDDQFEECKIGIIYKGADEEKAYEYENVSIKNLETNSVTIYISGINNLNTATLNDIVIGNISYIKDQAHTNFNSQLIRANVSVNDITGLDKYIRETGTNGLCISQGLKNKGNIKIKESDHTSIGMAYHFKDKDLSNMTCIKDNEYYFIYIGLIDYKGKLINTYPIYNTEANAYFFKSSNFNMTGNSLSEGNCNHKLVNFVIDPSEFLTKLFQSTDYDEASKKTYGEIARKQIQSWVCYIAQPNSSNSNWCCQSLTVRDIGISNVVGNTYLLPFASNERFRLYPLEYLIEKKTMPQVHLYSVRSPYERMTWIYCINRRDSAATNESGENNYIWEEGGDEMQSVLLSDSLRVNGRASSGNVVKPEFITNNNSAVSNVASDSCYKYSVNDGLNHNDVFDVRYYKYSWNNKVSVIVNQNKKLSELLGDGGAEKNKISIEDEGLTEYFDPNNARDHWRVLVENNRAIVDCYYNNRNADSIFNKVDVYSQNLTCVSPIINVKYNSLTYVVNSTPQKLKGDTFIAFITQRCICPALKFGFTGANSTINNCHRIIVSYFIFSRMNLQCRHDGLGINNSAYKIFERNKCDPGSKGVASVQKAPKNDYYQEVDNLGHISHPIDNFWNNEDGKCYETAMNWDGFKDATIFKKIEDIKSFPSRLIRSDVNPSESTDIGWRRYKADNYKDISIQKGQIENVLSDDIAIYIQQRYTLLVAAVKDTLGNNDENATYVGTSDLFQREPKEVIYSTTGKIGCNNRFASCITHNGYLVCDNAKGEIYLVKNDTGVKELSDLGFKEWFREHISESAVNPLSDNGNFFTYDEINNRFIFTVKILKAGVIDSEKSYSISYSLKTNLWTSFHSYIGDYSYINRKGIFYIKSGNLFAISSTNKGIYFDSTIHPSIVQFIYAQEPNVSKLFKHIEWRSQLINGLLNNEDRLRYIYNKTIDWLMFHTDTQCTGLMPISTSPIWWDNETLKYKAGRYIWNQIEDFIDDDKLQWNPNTNTVNVLDNTAINALKDLSINSRKPWYDISKIHSAWSYITMIYENKFFDEDIDDYVKAINPVTKELEYVYDSNKSLAINPKSKQLEFRLTDIEVIIDKDSRL